MANWNESLCAKFGSTRLTIFTQWLNIAELNTTVDLTLVNVDREQAAGSFSIDLVAESKGGGTVIIENQLEKSNHDHLGKLITHLSPLLKQRPRSGSYLILAPNMFSLIAWLNASSSATFYMVKVEAVRIGTSPAAPLFTLIVGPSDDAKEVGQTKREIAGAVWRPEALVDAIGGTVCGNLQVTRAHYPGRILMDRNKLRCSRL